MIKEVPSPIENFRFTVPAFRHKGKEYLSQDVASAAGKGEESAIMLMGELIKIRSGVIEPTPHASDDSTQNSQLLKAQ